MTLDPMTPKRTQLVPTSSQRLAPRARGLTDERGSAAAWILAFIVLAGVAFAVYWFVIRKPGAESSGLAARVMPAEVDVVGGLDIARVVSDPKIRELAKANGTDLDTIEAELAKTGVKLGDLKALVFGGRMGADNLKDALVAVEANSDTKALVGALQGVVMMLPDPLKGFMTGARVEALEGGVVLTGSGELLDLALKVAKGEAPALASRPGLDEVRKALDLGAILWVASPIPSNLVAMLPGMIASQLGGTPSHFGFSVSISDGAVLRAALHIPGADGSKVASSIKLLLGMFKARLGEVNKLMIDNLDLSGDGATVIAKITLTQAQVSDILAKSK